MLGTLETSCGLKPDLDEILKVNQSVTRLLDSVMQNQMLLKNKMDKALQALSEVCPKPPCPPPCPPGPKGPPGPQGDRGPAGPPGPVCCPCKCSAVFKSDEKCKLWCAGSTLSWNIENPRGKCVCLDPCDKTKIGLRSKGRFAVSFSVNVCAKGCNCNAAIILQMIKNNQRKDLYTVRSTVPCDGEAITMSMGGVIIENPDFASSLLLKLEAPDSLIVKDSMFSIMEI